MGNKYYAVRCGKMPGIYNSWEECEIQIKGYPGAEYKKFDDIESAKSYISFKVPADGGPIVVTALVNDEVEAEIDALDESEVIAFVDGSYSGKEEKAGFGVVIIDSKRIESSLYKSFVPKTNPDIIKYRNIFSELEGVKEAVLWAIKYNKTRIKIYYDYDGIGKWISGEWAANKKISQDYVKFINDNKNLIKIDFQKVSAHTGVIYNEKADALAKQSLVDNGYKTYADGSIYMVGYSSEDWKTIVNFINEENACLENKGTISFFSEKLGDGKRERLIIESSNNKVVINCYPPSKSYIQGKQSVLFEKMISMAVELLRNDEAVVETLNKVHVLTITQQDVEVKFESILPDFSDARNGKHYNNLLSAVYNTMVSGYMPDYTALLMPMFRSYEHYLHEILHGKMGLETTTDKGVNCFAFFREIDDKKFECTSRNKDSLSGDQLDYLNKLYTEYHQIRHKYSHWSDDETDVAVITEMELAQEILSKGLTLINNYYILF